MASNESPNKPLSGGIYQDTTASPSRSVQTKESPTNINQGSPPLVRYHQSNTDGNPGAKSQSITLD